MDGIGTPIVGFLVGIVLFSICMDRPRFRGLAFAALISPFASSLVFILGSFILADMNPAIEYGPSYVPNGTEHDPTRGEVLLWLAAMVTTFLLSAFVCFRTQQLLGSRAR